MSFIVFATGWRRDVGIVAGGRALSLLGDEVAIVALILHASDAPNAAFLVMLLLAAAMLPALLLAPISGLLVDRLPTRALVTVTSLSQAAICGALVVVEQPAVILLLVFALNAAQSVVGPAWQALLPRLVPPDRLPSALSALQASSAVAGMLGPALGGLLVGLSGVQTALVVDSLSFLALTAAALLVRGERRPAPSDAGQSMARESVAGFRHLRSEPVVAALVVLLSGFILVLGAVNVAEVFLVTDVLDASAAMYGLMGTLFAAGALAGALLAPRLHAETAPDPDRRLSQGVLIACLTVSFGIGLAACAPSLLVLGAASLVIGVGQASISIWAQVLVVRRTPDEIRGRVFAALQAAMNGAMMLALGAGGLALALTGPRVVVAVAAAAAALVILALAPVMLRQGRSLATSPSSEPALKVAASS
jgi:MFS family permease